MANWMMLLTSSLSWHFVYMMHSYRTNNICIHFISFYFLTLSFTRPPLQATSIRPVFVAFFFYSHPWCKYVRRNCGNSVFRMCTDILILSPYFIQHRPTIICRSHLITIYICYGFGIHNNISIFHWTRLLTIVLLYCMCMCVWVSQMILMRQTSMHL